MSPFVVRVLVLYSHPLMGEGLGRMLAVEPGIEVESADIAEPGAVAAALAHEPEVVIIEEGGPLDAADIVRRSRCSVVLDVDITTTRAWTLRRETLSTRPDDFLAMIRSIVGHSGHPGPGPGPETDRGLQPVPIPG